MSEIKEEVEHIGAADLQDFELDIKEMIIYPECPNEEQLVEPEYVNESNPINEIIQPEESHAHNEPTTINIKEEVENVEVSERQDLEELGITEILASDIAIPEEDLVEPEYVNITSLSEEMPSEDYRMEPIREMPLTRINTVDSVEPEFVQVVDLYATATDTNLETLLKNIYYPFSLIRKVPTLDEYYLKIVEMKGEIISRESLRHWLSSLNLKFVENNDSTSDVNIIKPTANTDTDEDSQSIKISPKITKLITDIEYRFHKMQIIPTLDSFYKEFIAAADTSCCKLTLKTYLNQLNIKYQKNPTVGQNSIPKSVLEKNANSKIPTLEYFYQMFRETTNKYRPKSLIRYWLNQLNIHFKDEVSKLTNNDENADYTKVDPSVIFNLNNFNDQFYCYNQGEILDMEIRKLITDIENCYKTQGKIPSLDVFYDKMTHRKDITKDVLKYCLNKMGVKFRIRRFKPKVYKHFEKLTFVNTPDKLPVPSLDYFYQKLTDKLGFICSKTTLANWLDLLAILYYPTDMTDTISFENTLNSPIISLLLKFDSEYQCSSHVTVSKILRDVNTKFKERDTVPSLEFIVRYLQSYRIFCFENHPSFSLDVLKHWLNVLKIKFSVKDSQESTTNKTEEIPKNIQTDLSSQIKPNNIEEASVKSEPTDCEPPVEKFINDPVNPNNSNFIAIPVESSDPPVGAILVKLTDLPYEISQSGIPPQVLIPNALTDQSNISSLTSETNNFPNIVISEVRTESPNVTSKMAVPEQIVNNVLVMNERPDTDNFPKILITDVRSEHPQIANELINNSENSETLQINALLETFLNSGTHQESKIDHISKFRPVVSKHLAKRILELLIGKNVDSSDTNSSQNKELELKDILLELLFNSSEPNTDNTSNFTPTISKCVPPSHVHLVRFCKDIQQAFAIQQTLPTSDYIYDKIKEEFGYIFDKETLRFILKHLRIKCLDDKPLRKIRRFKTVRLPQNAPTNTNLTIASLNVESNNLTTIPNNVEDNTVTNTLNIDNHNITNILPNSSVTNTPINSEGQLDSFTLTQNTSSTPDEAASEVLGNEPLDFNIQNTATENVNTQESTVNDDLPCIINEVTDIIEIDDSDEGETFNETSQGPETLNPIETSTIQPVEVIEICDDGEEDERPNKKIKLSREKMQKKLRLKQKKIIRAHLKQHRVLMNKYLRRKLQKLRDHTDPLDEHKNRDILMKVFTDTEFEYHQKGIMPPLSEFYKRVVVVCGAKYKLKDVRAWLNEIGIKFKTEKR